MNAQNRTTLHSILNDRNWLIYSLLTISFCFVFSCLLAHDIRYIRSEKSFSEVHFLDKSSWNFYSSDHTIYKGFANGKYWFLIEFQKIDEDFIISIPNAHITDAKLYWNDLEMRPLEGFRYITFKIPERYAENTAYLMVNCQLEAKIPVKVESEKRTVFAENNEFLVMGFYYGITLAIIVINILSYRTFRDRTYLFYIPMVIGMSLNVVYNDGIFFQLFGRGGLINVIEPTINSIVPISAIWFTDRYLSLRTARPKIFKLCIILIVVTQCLNLYYILSGVDLLLFTVLDVLILITLDIYWIAGLSLWKKSFEARLFTIAYGIPLFFAHDIYLLPNFGLRFLDLGTTWYKVGSIFEMVVFTYAIMHRARRLNKQLRDMKAEVLEFTIQWRIESKKLSEEAVAMELIRAYNFTLKEIEILKDIALQKTNIMIAKEHFISVNTVKTHIRSIFEKLKVNSKQGAGERYRSQLSEKSLP